MKSYINEERTLNLLQLVIEYFKRWRVILIAAVIGAVLMVGFCLVKGPAVITPSNEVITANQKKIDANNASIAEHNKSINSNNSQISTNKKTIPVRENDIVVANAKLDEQRKDLATYENLLNEANRLKNTASADVRAELIGQITELMEKIPAMKAEIATVEETIAGYEKEISSMQYAIDTSLPKSTDNLTTKIETLQQENEQLQAEMEPQEKSKSVGDYIKFAIIGCLLGAVAIACYVLIQSVTSRKINSVPAFVDRYNAPVLADLHVSSDKYNTRIDSLLKKLAGARDSITDEDHTLLAAKLRAICPDDVNEILIVSSADRAHADELCSNLSRYLGNELSVRMIGNPVRNADAAIAAKNACAIIVEKIDESFHSEVRNILEQLSLSNTSLLGGVLV